MDVGTANPSQPPNLHGVDSQTGQIIRTEVANRMTPDCQFTKTELGKVDARCAGCKHKADSGNA
ncbi:MAG: hypothetical protein IPN06_20355 [Burkholderiales bacterium]|nr:hypothetical protein [Burkholderiales bacterium]